MHQSSVSIKKSTRTRARTIFFDKPFDQMLNTQRGELIRKNFREKILKSKYSTSNTQRGCCQNGIMYNYFKMNDFKKKSLIRTEARNHLQIIIKFKSTYQLPLQAP